MVFCKTSYFAGMYALLQNQMLRRVLLHVGFWFGLWGLLSFSVLESTLNKEFITKAAVYAWVVLSCAVAGYVNNYGLLPRLLRRRRYALYLAALFGLIGGVSWCNDVLLAWWIGTQPMVLERFFSLLGITVFVMGIKLLRNDFAVQLRVSTLERIQAEQELQLLKSQVNPHFLFNTLNSIYALALSDSGRTADTVLKLADLMQYMVSTARLPSVELTKEIAYLVNYLSLEKIRLNPAADITFRRQGDFSSVHIAPMLLLPFVENAFKHGVQTQVQNIHVEIDASLQGDELFFRVLNSKPGGQPRQNGPATQTGLGNVSKRLALLYPDQHELTLTETHTDYTVNLWLKL